MIEGKRHMMMASHLEENLMKGCSGQDLTSNEWLNRSKTYLSSKLL